MPCKSLWWAEKEGEEWRDKSFVPSPFQYLVPTTHWLLSGHTAALNRFLRMSKNFWGLRGCARGWLWNGWGVNLSTFLEVGEGKGSAVHPLARAQNPPILPVCPPLSCQPQTPSNSEYRQERLGGAPAGVVRCKIIGPEQNICQKWRSAQNFRCIFGEFVDSFWQGGIMKDYGMKCVLTDRCV